MTKRLKIGQIARAICLLTQKWLDATHRASHNRKVMKKQHIMFLSAAAMLGLCACEDETAPVSTSVATETAKQEVTTPPAEVKPDAQKALFEALLYDLGKLGIHGIFPRLVGVHHALLFAVFVLVLMFKPNGILSKDRG